MKEKELCKNFYQRVRLMQEFNQFNDKFFIFHIANEQYNNLAYTLSLVKIGLKKGVADYCILLEGGKVAFIEFKRNNKCKLTDSQKEFKEICEILKIPYFLCFEVETGINIIKELTNSS